MHRIKRSEYSIAALREMLLIALVHINYLGSSMVQMRMFNNHFNFKSNNIN